ncbi:MAG: hypothetical protein NVS9B10_09250 [Nevskia sp.]
MSMRMACLFMASMCVVSLVIAGFFALQGYWPVLPFAGLELAALAAALWVSLRRNRYREILVFENERITVRCGMIGEGASLQLEWPRSSTRVHLERGVHRNDPTRLTLSNAGRQLVLARCLTDEDRARLAKRLRELIHPGWRGVALPESGIESADFNI